MAMVKEIPLYIQHQMHCYAAYECEIEIGLSRRMTFVRASIHQNCQFTTSSNRFTVDNNARFRSPCAEL